MPPPRKKKPTKRGAAGRSKTAGSARRGAKPSTGAGKKRTGANPAKPLTASAKPHPPKRRPRPATQGVPAETPAGERLQKVLAAAGIASRRECELLIQEGRVQVDGVAATELGVRVDAFTQAIHVDGEPLPTPKRVYFAVNKPEGVVCSARDPSGRPRVTDLLPPDVGRVFNVGRLDMASEGLILVTNDGELANQLTHPRHGVQKTYHVQVAGHPTVETLATLRGGVRLAEGTAHFVDARIKSRRKKSTLLEIVLDEGRNREIRRVLARVDHKVQKLTRVAVGPVRLGEMPAGAYRPLTAKELKALRDSVDAPPSAAAPATRGGRRTKITRLPAKAAVRAKAAREARAAEQAAGGKRGKPAGKPIATAKAAKKPGRAAAGKRAGATKRGAKASKNQRPGGRK